MNLYWRSDQHLRALGYVQTHTHTKRRTKHISWRKNVPLRFWEKNRIIPGNRNGWQLVFLKVYVDLHWTLSKNWLKAWDIFSTAFILFFITIARALLGLSCSLKAPNPLLVIITSGFFFLSLWGQQGVFRGQLSALWWGTRYYGLGNLWRGKYRY